MTKVDEDDTQATKKRAVTVEAHIAGSSSSSTGGELHYAETDEEILAAERFYLKHIAIPEVEKVCQSISWFEKVDGEWRFMFGLAQTARPCPDSRQPCPDSPGLSRSGCRGRVEVGLSGARPNTSGGALCATSERCRDT